MMVPRPETDTKDGVLEVAGENGRKMLVQEGFAVKTTRTSRVLAIAGEWTLVS